MDYSLALMCGTDIPIPECQLIAHQPKMKEIALIGEKQFFLGIQTILIDKNMISQDKTLLSDTNNFQIFMTIMAEEEMKDKRDAVLDVFQLVFEDARVALLPRSIVLTKGEHSSCIDESNFDALQEIMKQIFCFSSGPMDKQTFNPADEQARKIADKLNRARARVAAEKGDAGASVFSQYMSSIVVGVSSMSLGECKELTMYQLFDIMERYGLWMAWDIDIKSRLAGATGDSQPDNWMKNIH